MLTYHSIAALEGVHVDTVRKYASKAYPQSRRLKVLRKNARLHHIPEANYQRFLEANEKAA